MDWDVGNSIIVASTSHWHGYSNPTETEQHVIADVTANGYCLILASPLRYDHRAETWRSAGPEDPNSKEYRDRRWIEMRAEVALLTHNVRCRPTSRSIWPPHWVPVPACALCSV